MNFKLLFPTYRTRYRYVEDMLHELVGGQRVDRMLNLGTGEGDYDRMIKRSCRELFACDINEEDIEFAQRLNRDVPGIHYAVADGQALDYPSAHFDLVTCIEVVEHVDQPALLVAEIGRVLKPGGTAIVTCPNYDFPLAYDPLNRWLRLYRDPLPFGAYAYGHTKLIRETDLERWFADQGLTILGHRRLTGSVAAVTECYWPGLLQRMLKANSRNATARTRRRFVLKPSLHEPAGTVVTDAVIALDRRLSRGRWSVGLGYVVRK